MDFLINNWWYILLIGFFGFMMFRGGGCCGGHSHEDHNHGEDGHSADDSRKNLNDSVQNNVDMVRDPVCGMYIYPDTAIKEEVDGKTYYFCSESCRTKFLHTQAAN